ncbi:hypothetical protein R1flu_019979 [Riccia fluitans]|uniref:Uncharacterized protein n=1 Tax=Riccia fluitans TaxID=41844 RepID=A0ABD1ZLU5_9MARC
MSSGAVIMSRTALFSVDIYRNTSLLEPADVGSHAHAPVHMQIQELGSSCVVSQDLSKKWAQRREIPPISRTFFT